MPGSRPLSGIALPSLQAFASFRAILAQGPTTRQRLSSRSLASHRKAIRSRCDGNVAVFDGTREHTTRFLNGIDAGIGRMAVSIPLTGACEGKLGLQDVQQLTID